MCDKCKPVTIIFVLCKNINPIRFWVVFFHFLPFLRWHPIIFCYLSLLCHIPTNIHPVMAYGTHLNHLNYMLPSPYVYGNYSIRILSSVFCSQMRCGDMAHHHFYYLPCLNIFSLIPPLAIHNPWHSRWCVISKQDLPMSSSNWKIFCSTGMGKQGSLMPQTLHT